MPATFHSETESQPYLQHLLKCPFHEKVSWPLAEGPAKVYVKNTKGSAEIKGLSRTEKKPKLGELCWFKVDPCRYADAGEEKENCFFSSQSTKPLSMTRYGIAIGGWFEKCLQLFTWKPISKPIIPKHRLKLDSKSSYPDIFGVGTFSDCYFISLCI